MGKASPNWVICRSNKDKCMLPLKIASIIELLNGIKHSGADVMLPPSNSSDNFSS